MSWVSDQIGTIFAVVGLVMIGCSIVLTERPPKQMFIDDEWEREQRRQ